MKEQNNWKERFLSILYPRHCPICHEIVRPKGALICPGCAARVHYVGDAACSKCGKPIADAAIEYCFDCNEQKHHFIRGYALAVYDEKMRESIRRFKNGGRMEYADWYAAEIWERYGQELSAIRADALVPVPLHYRKEADRGYNQATLIAQRLGRNLGLPVLTHAIERNRYTAAQKYLGRQARRHNLESGFRPGRQLVTDKKLILVDDIYTTGATADSCSEVLLAAGAKGVWLMNVCIGEQEG